MNTPRLTKILLLTWIVSLLIGCATLPHYARPVSVDADSFRMEDVIHYRELERSDFKGEEPPAGFDRRMAAAICSQVKPFIEMEYQGQENGSHVYLVKFREPAFRAIMDRDCSWWNQDVDAAGEEYILEHETIHFALSEIAAREWNANLPWDSVRISGLDEAELMQDLESQTDEFFRPRREELLQRNLRFDEETSAVYDPVKQKQWLLKVQQELSRYESQALAMQCEPDADTREAMKNARLALRLGSYRPAILELVREAEAAAGLPECDRVRAKILADKALELARYPDSRACLVDAETRQMVDSALSHAEGTGGEVESLLQQAQQALEPPQCDSVRARILVDKAQQLSAE